MGGRGASSSGKHRKISGTTASGKPGRFFDMTRNFTGMSLHEFENAIRGKSSEYLGGFDKDGNLIVAGTSGEKGSVVIPTGHPEFSKITTITHNHPSDANRPLGGTFSEADVQILGRYSQLNSMRAVANGKGEHSYIMNKSGRKTANSDGLRVSAQNAELSGKLDRMGNANVARVQQNVGRPLTNAEINRAYIGGMKKAWTDIAKQNGYDYIPLKKAPW